MVTQPRAHPGPESTGKMHIKSPKMPHCSWQMI